MPNIEKLLFKTGTSSSEISTDGKVIRKTIFFNNDLEENALKNGLKILLKYDPKSVLAPLEIIDSPKKDFKSLRRKLTYIQEIKRPWLYPQWITGQMLYDLANNILKQQEILVKNGLCLVDCRPENYWLASKPYSLVDLGSIKPLTSQNIESFRSDFSQYIFNPLLLEKYMNIPVSASFKGELYKFNILPMRLINSWFSKTISIQSIRDYINNFISQKVLNSSPEFIEFLYSSHTKKHSTPSKKLLKRISLIQSQLLKKVKPNLNHNSEWINYQNFHDDSYLKNKNKAINLFLSKINQSRKIVDLGSNLTTINNTRIDIRIDKDISVCRELYRESSENDITLLLDIAEALTQKNHMDFMGLNCNGYADAAIIMGLIHHIVIDSGLNVDALYYSLSLLFNDILLEFPLKNDPMVKTLMKKKNEFIDWSWEDLHYKTCKNWFNIIHKETLSETRFAIHLEKKND